MRQAQVGRLRVGQGPSADGPTSGALPAGRAARARFGLGAGRKGRPGGRHARIGGRYVLGDVLGRGGMGTVYQALDTRRGEQVALKLLAGAPGADERRSHNEAHALQRLDHPNLVRLLDVGREGDELYLVMDLLAGRTLFSRLRERPLSLEEAAGLGRDVAAALAYVHSHDIVHRDVKPANIMMGEDGSARLTDFGIALLSTSPALTATGVTVGTPAYLAPEQAEGYRAGPPADVYALGLVLIESLTGGPVFSGTPGEMMVARMWRDPPLPAWLDEGWRNLLAAMTTRAPAQRASAAAVCAYLGYRADVVPSAAVAAPGTYTPEAEAVPMARPTPPGRSGGGPDRGRPGRRTLALSMAGVAAAAAAVVMLPTLAGNGAGGPHGASATAGHRSAASTASPPRTSAPTTATNHGTTAPPAGPARSSAPSSTLPAGPASHQPPSSSGPTTGASSGPLTALSTPANARTASAGTKGTGGGEARGGGHWPGAQKGQPTAPAGQAGAASSAGAAGGPAAGGDGAGTGHHWAGGHDWGDGGHHQAAPGQGGPWQGQGGAGNDHSGPGHDWGGPGPGHGHGYGHQGWGGQGGNGPDATPPAPVR